MDTENMEIVQAEIVVEEGWTEDPSGLPIFTAASIDAIENEMVGLRATEGEQRLKVAAVLTEASERRFYGEGTLNRVAKENQITPSTARDYVAAYKRLRTLDPVDRSTIVSSITSGELYFSKPQIAAPVKDNQTYMELMHLSADGSLSNSKLRKRVQTLSGSVAGQKAIDAPEDEDQDEDTPEAEDAEEGRPYTHAENVERFIVGGLVLAQQLEEAGGVKVLEAEEIPEDLKAFTKLIRRWDDQLRRKQRGE